MNIENYNTFDISKSKFDTSKKIDTSDKKKLKKAAEGLEGEFLKIMLKSMMKTTDTSISGQNVPGKKIMKEYMIERYAEMVAKQSPLGIAKMIEDHYARTVEAQEDAKNNKEVLEHTAGMKMDKENE